MLASAATIQNSVVDELPPTAGLGSPGCLQLARRPPRRGGVPRRAVGRRAVHDCRPDRIFSTREALWGADRSREMGPSAMRCGTSCRPPALGHADHCSVLQACCTRIQTNFLYTTRRGAGLLVRGRCGIDAAFILDVSPLLHKILYARLTRKETSQPGKCF